MSFKCLTKLMVAASAMAFATIPAPVSAYTLTGTPDCDVAADVFSPEYDECLGAYLLDNSENDVTDGEADNIVNQLLNVDDVFGEDPWTFLGKQDDSSGSSFFTINGIDSTTGSVVFDTGLIDAEFGPAFLTDYEIVISFKAAKNFSLYKWDAPIGTDTILWSTEGTAVNNGGTARALSHGSVYFRKGATTVSEPGTLALLGLGLIGAGLARRRKAA